MRFMTIASGSKGNCVYVGSEKTHILVDAGVSTKRIEEGLKTAQISPEDLSAIFITHEHTDHILALTVLSKKYGIPIYATKGTIEGIRTEKKVQVDESLYNTVDIFGPAFVGDLRVMPFEISHDTAEPVGYRVMCNEKTIVVATDMGTYDDYTVGNLKDAQGLVLEANHDIRMVQAGSYPYYLKQRVLSDKGHLCNEMSGRLLDRVLNSEMKKVLLGHLSEHNNYPELALESVRLEINLSDSEYRADDFDISVAPARLPSELVYI